MAIWHTSSKFEACQTAIIVSSGLPRRPNKFQFKRKYHKLPLLSAAGCHALLDGQLYRLRTGIFFHSKVEKTSEGINMCLFFMNKKGLMNLQFAINC
jgi:hypothetical protein